MEIINFNVHETYHFDPLAVTIGAFDGIHLGHIALIKTLMNQNKDLKKAVITFETHPDYTLNKRLNYGVVNTIEEKARIFETLKVDYMIILPNDILSLSYNEFNSLLSGINVKTVVTGKDFRYGYQGEGNTQTLKQSFNVIVVEDVNYHGKRISSSDLRLLLSLGNIEEINKLMQEPFKITGIVIHGSGIGTSLGFSTANVEIGCKYYDIRHGVYLCSIIIDGQIYDGIANIGCNPTLNELKRPRLEVHILNFHQEIYEQKITIIIKRFLRDEKKFSNREELIKAITNDILEAKK